MLICIIITTFVNIQNGYVNLKLVQILAKKEKI